MGQMLLMTALYALFMYFMTMYIYKRKNVELSRPELLIRTVVSAGIFFALLYFLGNI